MKTVAATSEVKFDLASSIRGRTVLVTGGTRGIGKECVLSLIANGARVALTYNQGQEAGERLARKLPRQTSCHKLDLRCNDSIERCVSEVQSRWGGLHILVHNAAVGSATVGRYEGTLAKQASAFFEINAAGALSVCEVAIRAMKANKDRLACKVINISSVGGGFQVFPSFDLADGMSKGTVATLSRHLAAMLVHSNIDVFCVCPGATNTEMFWESTLQEMTRKNRAAFIKNLPKMRLIDPKEIARLVVFLASEHSTVLHGAVIDASMGLGVRPGLLTESRLASSSSAPAAPRRRRPTGGSDTTVPQ